MNRLPLVITACVLSVIALTMTITVQAQERPATSKSADSLALSSLFGEQHTLESAVGVHQRAAALSGLAKYEFLSAWVLPGLNHADFRMQVGFTPTHPAHTPGVPLPTGTCIQTGGDLVSPALDLIAAAAADGRLETLREQVEGVAPQSAKSQVERLSMLALIDMTQGNSESASPLLEEMFSLVLSGTGLLEETGDAVLLCVHQAGHNRSLSRVIVDAAYQIFIHYRDTIYHHNSWQRQFTAAYARLRQVAATDPQQSQTDNGSARATGQWTQVSRKLAHYRGSGAPLAVWDVQPGAVENLSGHNDDYLYFQSPLGGSYEVEADVGGFGWRDTQLLVTGKWVGPIYTLDSYEVGNLRGGEGRTHFSPKLTKPKEFLHTRVVVRDGMTRWFFNGRPLHKEPLPSEDAPWLAIRSSPRHFGGVRNLRITGDVVIPRQVRLSKSSTLAGWVPYFDERVGSHWQHQGVLFGPAEIHARHRQELPTGCFQESLLVYQRPMLEDGSIEYEFWYEPGVFEAHPALDRLCLLLREDGVNVHWLTDGPYDRTPLTPDNVITQKEHRRGPETLPLQSSAWNRLRLAITGDVLTLMLNDELIYERPIESTNQRTFGLFYFADQTALRVRNVVWTGDWPREVPPIAQQQLAIDETGFLEARLPELTATFSHDFVREGFRPDRFLIVRGDYPAHINAQPDGLHAGRPAVTGYRNATIAPSLTVSGDFDIQASFDGLVTDAYGEGTSRIMLIAQVGSDTVEEATLLRFRTLQNNDDRQLMQCLRVFNVNGQQRRRYFNHQPMEATSGTLRLARRGETIYYLIAEADSQQFRLIGQSDFPADDLQLEGVRLVAQISGDEGAVHVVWKNLTIRAEELAGVAVGDANEALEMLDEQRSQLAASFDYDFRRQAPAEADFDRWTDHHPWSAEEGGLSMTSPGSDNWTSAGAALLRQIEGDFDISMEFDLSELAMPTDGQESTIYLQVVLADEHRTEMRSIFKKTSTGGTEVLAQLRLMDDDGKVAYRVIGRLAVLTATNLRIARRGRRISFLSSSSDFGGERIIATTDLIDAPIVRGGTKFLVHTGGAGRTSSVVWKSLNLKADRVIGSEPTPPPAPARRSFFDFLFD